MPIPHLDQSGLLPHGVHDCSVDEINGHFGWNPHRAALFARFTDFLNREVRPHFPDPVYFDGSFVTDKDLPDDTDVVLDLASAPDDRKWRGLLFFQQHQRRIMQDYRVHFWINLPGNHDFAAFFQYIGVKTARAKGLDPLHHKGILRLI